MTQAYVELWLSDISVVILTVIRKVRADLPSLAETAPEKWLAEVV